MLAAKAMSLRCWELPSSVARPTGRPVRPAPAERTQALAPLQKGRQNATARGLCARPAPESPRAPAVAQDAAADAAPARARGELGEHSVGTDWPLDAAWEPLAEVGGVLPPFALGADSKSKFYGAMIGQEVENELRRLAKVLAAVVNDFTLFKDSLWHLENERHAVFESMDRLEKERQSATTFDSRMDYICNRLDLQDMRLAALEQSDAVLKELTGRVELMDVRLSAREEAHDCGGFGVLANHLNSQQTLTSEVITEGEWNPIEGTDRDFPWSPAALGVSGSNAGDGDGAGPAAIPPAQGARVDKDHEALQTSLSAGAAAAESR